MKVSFVIPNYNGRELLSQNLPFVCEAAGALGAEIIIVDDASGDSSVEFVKKKYPKIKLLIHKDNTRFAASCNDGVIKAQGDIVIILNNDVRPEVDFAFPLIKHFANPRIFAVGCLETDKNGLESGRSSACFTRGFYTHRRTISQAKGNTAWVAAGSGAFNKNIWLKLAGLDTLYKPAYWEDIDLGYRALKAGYEIKFEPKSRVFHDHTTTNLKEFGSNKLLTAAFKNQILFVWKNITDSDLLIAHFFWLVWHLIFSTINTRGLFLLGFAQAVGQAGPAFKARKQAGVSAKLSDKEVLALND